MDTTPLIAFLRDLGPLTDCPNCRLPGAMLAQKEVGGHRYYCLTCAHEWTLSLESSQRPAITTR